jgi:hypothetical protein
MAQTEVLISFHCCTGAAESIALAAAVGAVQARAMIRLRRLPDVDSHPNDETFARMLKEYVAPTEADVVRADVLIYVPPAGFTPASIEWRDHFELLGRLQSQGKLSGKHAAVLGEIDHSRDAFTQTLQQIGLTIVPTDSPDPIFNGRTIAAHAKTR